VRESRRRCARRATAPSSADQADREGRSCRLWLCRPGSATQPPLPFGWVSAPVTGCVEDGDRRRRPRRRRNVGRQADRDGSLAGPPAGAFQRPSWPQVFFRPCRRRAARAGRAAVRARRHWFRPAAAALVLWRPRRGGNASSASTPGGRLPRGGERWVIVGGLRRPVRTSDRWGNLLPSPDGISRLSPCSLGA